MKTWLIIGGALAVGIILMASGGGDSSSLNHGGTTALSSNGASSGNGSGAASLIDDDVILGDPNAPVTLVEFGDYQCTFCTRFFEETFSFIKEQYIDTGAVKMVFRDFAINGRESVNAALASQCAADQEEFWPYHERLFQERRGYGVGVFEEDNLVRWAGEFGMDTIVFRQCYISRKHSAEITNDRVVAQRIGARGTPTFVIGNRLVPGAQPFSVFQQLIEAELSAVDNAVPTGSE